MVSGNERRDRLGRRIGRNWWREWITEMWATADEAWRWAAEDATHGYETEMDEYRREHPRPLFKDYLLANAGMKEERA